MMKKKLVSIDFLRILMVWGVVLYHINEDYPLHRIFSSMQAGVYGCVVIAGFLSGYLHGNDYADWHLRDSIRSVKKKLRKFYPVHFLTFCLAAFLLIPDFLNYGIRLRTLLFHFVNGAVNLLLLQSFVPSIRVIFGYNGVSWYLSMTMALYFAAPWLIHQLQQRKTPEEKYVFCAAVWVTVNLLQCLLLGRLPALSLLYVHPAAHIPVFLLSIAVGMMYAEGSTPKPARWGRLLTGLTVLCLSVVVKRNVMVATRADAACSDLLELQLLIVLLVFLKIPFRSSRIIESLSETSFEMYMIHQIVMRYSPLVMRTADIPPAAAFIGVFAVSLGLSYAFHGILRFPQMRTPAAH